MTISSADIETQEIFLRLAPDDDACLSVPDGDDRGRRAWL